MTVVSVYVFMKYILTLVMPFFLAFCIISAVQPLLRWLEEKLHIRKRIIAVILLVFAVCILSGIVWYVVGKLGGQISFLTQNMGRYENSLNGFVHSGCQKMEQYLGIDAERMEDTIFLHVNNFTADMEQKALPKLMNKSVFYVKVFAAAAGFLGMTLIATVLLAKDFRKIQADLQKYKWYRVSEEVGIEIGRLAVDYLKAQLTILSVIGGVSGVALWLIGIKHGILAGILTGFMDALPFIGTGIVLVPMALWQLIQGKVWQSMAVLLLYVGCILLREFLEPKLIGKQMDIYPVVVLLSIYVGIGLYGLAGVVTGPLSFLLIREIWRKIADFEKDVPDFAGESSDFCGDD